MAREEIDDYLAGLDRAPREALEHLRSTILEIIPEAEESTSYGVPAFSVDGKVVAGFGAFKNHLSYFPHSEAVLSELAGELGRYSMSKGTLRFPVDEPLPNELVRQLIEVRLGQLGAGETT